MIFIGLFFIALGAIIHFGKFYFLIAGYNTMTAEDKKKVEIVGVAKLFWNVMLTMGFSLILIDVLALVVDVTPYREYVFWAILVLGLGYLILKSNSSKYKA